VTDEAPETPRPDAPPQESRQQESLADRALQRLRKLATGNGLEPAAITLLEAQEHIFTLTGVMEVSPSCETTSTSYPGPARGSDRRKVGSQSTLQEAVNRHKKQFQESPDWVAVVRQEILDDASKGWGLENARVTLPEKSAIYAATEPCASCDGRKTLTCTHCHGQGTVVCTQCQGQGREQCYYCGGNGDNPQQPGQRCTTCNGTRYAPCRFCQMRGHLPCPTCGGKRGTVCTACNGQGSQTNEVAVSCGAETHFKMIAGDLPSGLRRSLDRVGIANLVRGHADIEAVQPPGQSDEAQQAKAPFTILHYKITLPYAELRTAFGGKKAVVTAMGKRCVITGVPNFLDDSLRPWRHKLHLASEGKGALEEAIEARALKEILALTVAGKGKPDDVRRLYPFGFSSEILNAIIGDMQDALNHVTLRTRSVIAGSSVAVCALFFYFLFMTGLHAGMTQGWGVAATVAIDLGILGLALGLSWALLNFSTRFVLQKRFPQLAVALQQSIGKTGQSMLGGIAAAYVLFLLLAPVKPIWLTLMWRH
jgi:hypothetical protein